MVIGRLLYIQNKQEPAASSHREPIRGVSAFTREDVKQELGFLKLLHKESV